MFTKPLYAIKDVKSGFCDPCTQVNDAVAVRSFCSQIRSISDDLGIPVRDFQLWHVGRFDSDSGEVITEVPCIIFDGASLLEKEVPYEKPERSCANSE